MSLLVITLIVLVALLLIFLSSLTLILWRLLAEQRKTTESHDAVMSKAIALLASKNLESYQGIQVMESPSSTSTEDDEEFGTIVTDAEADELMAKYERGEPLNDREQSRFDRIFVNVG